MQRKRAPSAARFDHRFAAPQPQLPADEIHFRHLRLFEGHVGMVEVGAGVQHLVVEPACIEIVAEVIVMMNVATRLLEAVCALDVHADELAPRWQKTQSGNGLEHRLQLTSYSERAGHIRFAEVQMRVEQNPPERPWVIDDKRPDRRLGTRVQGRAIPQLQPNSRRHQSSLEDCGEPPMQPASHKLCL